MVLLGIGILAAKTEYLYVLLVLDSFFGYQFV